MLLGKTKSERELLEIAEEFGSEIGVPQFLEMPKELPVGGRPAHPAQET